MTGALVPIRRIQREFGTYYTEQMLREHPDKTPERPDALRVSGFPYCGLKHAYMRLTKHLEVKMAGFGAQFYTGVGTVTHEVVQGFLGHGGKMYGIWNCTTKGCGGRREFSKNNKCPRCSAVMAYEEFTVKAFRNVSGHLDGVYKSKNGEWWVVDYKTCSVRVLGQQAVERTLPYHHNVCQIRAYCALLETIYEVKISGWLLHYLARDDPARAHATLGARVTTKEKARELQKIKGWDKHFGLVMKKPVIDLNTLYLLAEEKPCKDRAYYDRQYATYNPCPLSKGGMCFAPKKQLQEFLELTLLENKQHRPVA